MIPIIDTHQHLIYPERYAYPWTAEIPQLAGRAFRHDDYLEAAEGCGIAASVFMEATGSDPSKHDEATFIDSLACEPERRIAGIVAACRPESEGFSAFLDALPAKRVVGLRRILHVVPDEVSQGSLFRENLRLLAPRGLPFDLCVLARQLPIALELAQACPEVRFVLDHCGVPDVRAGTLDPWRSHIAELAAMPNVACKISGLLAYCDGDHADLDAVRPFVEPCLESFGWDRVVWGSDWPLVEITSSLAAWVSISREIVAGESEENQRKLFAENARRIYDLALPASALR